MNKNNKGFTLIELLAVIVILSIILVIATTSVIKNINDSKEKAKYIAAKEIVEIASSYMAAETTGVSNDCVTTYTLVEQGYLEKDVTNPVTGKNDILKDDPSKTCKGSFTKQTDYKLKESDTNVYYEFDGYCYTMDK